MLSPRTNSWLYIVSENQMDKSIPLDTQSLVVYVFYESLTENKPASQNNMKQLNSTVGAV